MSIACVERSLVTRALNRCRLYYLFIGGGIEHMGNIPELLMKQEKITPRKKGVISQ